LRQKNGTSAAKAGCISATYGTAEAVPLQSRRPKRDFSHNLESVPFKGTPVEILAPGLRELM
jgi:hypothetical protein